MGEGELVTLREQTQEQERITLSPLACLSAESRGP